ncbi:MAG: hypothetical protein ACJ8GN_06900 [Longimicrobiaceae bacterium]
MDHFSSIDGLETRRWNSTKSAFADCAAGAGEIADLNLLTAGVHLLIIQHVRKNPHVPTASLPRRSR